MDDTQPQSPVAWSDLYARSERNQRRSRRAMLLSTVALLLAVVVVVAGLVYYQQQRKLQDVLNTVKATQDQAACRAELAADNETATTEFFTAIIAQPPDHARVQAAVDRLNQIVDARRQSEPCRALAALPASVGAPTPVPTLPAVTSTTATTGASTRVAAGATATPSTDPPQPTAICKDGTPSYATKHAGACSRHHGVDHWL